MVEKIPKWKVEGVEAEAEVEDADAKAEDEGEEAKVVEGVGEGE